MTENNVNADFLIPAQVQAIAAVRLLAIRLVLVPASAHQVAATARSSRAQALVQVSVQVLIRARSFQAVV